ncbi:DotG/IcmE/VirB10 family protein [Desulfovibrio sp. ZJ200]|uniref:DotG/IcmE/VirB10 family protein n=1 Tax=Desulfovibrio sp. ZJ200 TaxID=2709792 RepID=UPI0013EB1A7B|nr:DotG/IcmE/VirB10 family protein [Desulfovibrio sp. ZJ200]
MNLTSTENKRRVIMLGLLGTALAVVVVFAAFVVFTPEKPSSSARLVSARSESITGRAGGEGSDEYNDKLKKHDARQADAALQKGESFVPTPVGQRRPVVVKKEDTRPAPPPVVPVHTTPVRTQATDNAMLKRMMEDLDALDTKLSAVAVGEGKIVYLREFSEEAPAATPVAAIQETAPPANTPEFVTLKPGDLLYAIMDVGVNSDVPSAVLATVTSGAYRNARLMGGFQRHDERLVLAFNRAVLPSGETVQLEAYAVDPSTSEASVASSVNTHFFSRWGGLIASAFLEGLGSAKRYSGAQSTIYGYGNDATDQMVWNEYSLSDQAWIAAGKVGEKAGKIFEKGFDRPPTVRLASGTPVGVLVVNVKKEK